MFHYLCVCVLDPPAWAEIRIGVSYSCGVLHLKLQPYYGAGAVCGQRSCQRQIETTVIRGQNRLFNKCVNLQCPLTA